jgi:solute:Na+ symporter, SSS family
VSTLDFLVLAVYLLGTTALGIRLGRRQESSRDYFVGTGKTSWWAIMLSVVATETSSLTFISVPGLAYLTDLTFVQIAFGYLLGRIVVAYTLLPLYFNGEAVTAYALLEKRFGKGARRLASLTFMLTRVFGDSVRIYATAIPVALILGPLIPPAWVAPVSILTLGILTLLYTYHGGMRAVVWTDVIQTGVYLIGAGAAIVLLQGLVSGGWSSILSQAASAGKLRVFDFDLGFDKPYTLLAGVLGGGVLAMASHGVDQLFVQRLLGAGSLSGARKALIGSGVCVIAQMFLFLLIGTGLHAFYAGASATAPDAIFPRFIVEQMPAGLVGLVLAAILAAAMSTVSGALSSLAATTLHDIVLPLRTEPLDDAIQLRWSKRLTFLWSLVLIGGALCYTDRQTPVVTVALSIASFTYGGLLGAFALALLWPRAIQRDALAGMLGGMLLTALVVFAKPLAQYLPILHYAAGIAWPWFVLIGTGFTFAIGFSLSWLHESPVDTVAASPSIKTVTSSGTASRPLCAPIESLRPHGSRTLPR